MARIKVKVKSTGQAGTIEETEYNPSIYEFVSTVPQVETPVVQAAPAQLPVQASPPTQPTIQSPQPLQAPTDGQTATSQITLSQKPGEPVPPDMSQSRPPPPPSTSISFENLPVQSPQPNASTPTVLEKTSAPSFLDIQKKAAETLGKPPTTAASEPVAQSILPTSQMQTPPALEELSKSLKEKVNQETLPAQPTMSKETITPQTPTPSPTPPIQTAPATITPKNEPVINHNFVIPTPTPQVPKAEFIRATKPDTPPTPIAPEPNPHLKMPPLTHIPNVLNGIVQNQDGNLLEETIVLVKDKNNIPVRALKTNRLGQFVISTPVPNGTYRIEAEKENYLFDIIEIEAKGDVIAPITIKARSNG